jgi:hypothetical protein
VHQLIATIQLKYSSNVLANFDHVTTVLNNAQILQVSKEEQQSRLLAWINAVDTQKIYKTALRYHLDGTCEWSLELEELENWVASSSNKAKILWIHGPAGFGKSVMTAWIVHQFIIESQRPVAYFVCGGDNHATLDPYAILKSWLSQLLVEDDSVLSTLLGHFMTGLNARRKPGHSEL